MAKLSQNGVTDTVSDPKSRILFLPKNNPNRRWMQLIVLSDFSLTVCASFAGFNNRRLRSLCCAAISDKGLAIGRFCCDFFWMAQPPCLRLIARSAGAINQFALHYFPPLRRIDINNQSPPKPAPNNPSRLRKDKPCGLNSPCTSITMAEPII